MFLTPSGRRAVVYYQMTICGERLVKVRHRVVWGGREREINVGEKWISSLPAEFLSQKLDHGLKSVGRSNLVKVLPHDWCIADSLEPYYDLGRIFLLVSFKCFKCLGDAVQIILCSPGGR